MTTLSIVMPCHNRAHDLRRVLQAYDRQVVDQPFEIIAVDDASTDATYEVLSTYRPQRYTLRVERHAHNQGPAAARNEGIALATAPLLLFVGDDILPDPHLVRGHLEAHHGYPEPTTAILGRIVWPADMPKNTLMAHIDGVGAQQFSYHYLQDDHEYDFRHLYTSNVSLKTEFVRQNKPWFDTNFPYAAVEDAEFSYRLSQQGLRIIHRRAPIGYHYHYHTIWTFSTRQYRAGLMLCEMAKKHPELADFFRVTKTKFLLIPGRLQPLGRGDQLAQTAAWLEEQTLHLVSQYEWHHHQLLDDLYLEVLEYYWRKGLIDGVFENSRWQARIRHTYALYYLGNCLRTFLDRAAALHIPVPGGNLSALQQKISQVESPLVRQLFHVWRSGGYRLLKSWLYSEKLAGG